MFDERLDYLLRESIEASNRTTRAIRAAVRFFFIQLAGATFGGLLIFWGQSSQTCDYWGDCVGDPNTPLIVIGAIIWLIGVVWSSAAGWSELELSAIPASKIAAWERPIPTDEEEKAVSKSKPAKKSSKTETADVYQRAYGIEAFHESDEQKMLRLSREEYREWGKAGKPSLKTWNPSLDFIEWLKNNN